MSTTPGRRHAAERLAEVFPRANLSYRRETPVPGHESTRSTPPVDSQQVAEPRVTATSIRAGDARQPARSRSSTSSAGDVSWNASSQVTRTRVNIESVVPGPGRAGATAAVGRSAPSLSRDKDARPLPAQARSRQPSDLGRDARSQHRNSPPQRYPVPGVLSGSPWFMRRGRGRIRPPRSAAPPPGPA
jgi:hypothetical protein